MDDLTRYTDSILDRSFVSEFEDIVIENNSVDAETFEYYEYLNTLSNVSVVKWDSGFKLCCNQ